MHTEIYTGSLQIQSYIQSSQKPWGNPLSNHNLITYTTTKRMTLNTSRNTLFLANTLTPRLLILIPSRTHNQSQQTQKRNLFHRVQGLHWLQKIIWNQYKQNPIPQTLINHKLSAISALWKTQKTLLKNSCFTNLFFWIYSNYPRTILNQHSNSKHRRGFNILQRVWILQSLNTTWLNRCHWPQALLG